MGLVNSWYFWVDRFRVTSKKSTIFLLASMVIFNGFYWVTMVLTGIFHSLMVHYQKTEKLWCLKLIHRWMKLRDWICRDWPITWSVIDHSHVAFNSVVKVLWKDRNPDWQVVSRLLPSRYSYSWSNMTFSNIKYQHME